MEKLILIIAFLLASRIQHKPKEKLKRCVVTSVQATEYYRVDRPEIIYTYTTQCGYTVYDMDKYAVGDTISILIIGMKNYQSK